jgi:uroporphyrin-III C-methyltransferase
LTLTISGKVYFVGAGPGDPDLLTVKARDLLESADVILHDDLVPPPILSIAGPQSTIINVGKRCGPKRITQDEINSLMIETARLGFSVIRLKSGDPSIFGRLAEELDALDSAGIPYEVVPGITAAFAAVASACVSLTDRRTTSRVVLTTAHHSHEADSAALNEWKNLASEGATLAIYMPGNDWRALADALLTAGIPGDMPALVVSRATTFHERQFATTIRGLVSTPLMRSPSVLLIGRAMARVLRPTIICQPESRSESLEIRSNLLSPTAAPTTSAATD